MSVKRITAPAIPAVSLETTKRHLNVDHDDDDALIEVFISAATEHVQRFLGRALVDQVWELTIDEFPDEAIEIPLPPLIEVVSVKYDDGDGSEQTLATDSYTVDARQDEPSWVLPANDTWPTTFDGVNAVRVRFRAGYEATTDSPSDSTVPADIKAGILLMIGTLYANRETVVIGQTVNALPWSAEQILRAKRVHLGMA